MKILKSINTKLILTLLLLSVNISALDFTPLKNKQGIADRNNNILNSKRYDVYRDELDIGIQKYNYYWMSAEDSQASSKTPMVCKKGYRLFPKNRHQKELFNLHSYHCYKNSFITQWKKRFKKNVKYGISVAVVLWTTPQMYRDKGCEGFYMPLHKRHLMEGCYPKKEHYDDYEDWIKFTAKTFGNEIDHYIVWNEVNLNNWADISTQKYPRQEMIKNPAFHMKRAFETYADILKRSISAVESLDASEQNFVYISLTHDWYSKKIAINKTKNGSININWKNLNLLEYLWSNLGLDYNWSVAIHPYGEVYSKSKHALKFSTLYELSNYQKKMINTLKKDNNTSYLNYPQSKIFTSEQNIGPVAKAGDYKKKARYICESYEVAINMPEIIAITHNHFQDNVIHNTSKPTLHTMLPSSVKKDLSDAQRYETFRAYKSTSSEIWGKTDAHYCCKKHLLGCKK